MALNLHTIDPKELLPLPEATENYSPNNEEEKRVLEQVKEGLESGAVIPVDEDFFKRLHSRVFLKS